MLITAGTVLAGIVGIGIAVIGVFELWKPQIAAGFGIPDTPVEDRNFRSWLSVKADRDIGSGVLIIIVLIGGSPALIGWFMLAAACMPAADALIVLRSGGPKATAYGTHGGAAAVALASSILFFLA